jgi:dihydrofolate reductase
MGRAAYEGMAGALPTAGHPYTGIMNAARKVVFSRTLNTAEWANTTIAAGDTTEGIDKLRRGGDGHIVVRGGVGLWRLLMRLDLIDEFRLDLHPYVAGEGTRLSDDVPKSYRLDLVSQQRDRRAAVPSALLAAQSAQRVPDRRFAGVNNDAGGGTSEARIVGGACCPYVTSPASSPAIAGVPELAGDGCPGCWPASAGWW